MSEGICGATGPGRNVICQSTAGHAGCHRGPDWESTFARTMPGSLVTPDLVEWKPDDGFSDVLNQWQNASQEDAAIPARTFRPRVPNARHWPNVFVQTFPSGSWIGVCSCGLVQVRNYADELRAAQNEHMPLFALWQQDHTDQTWGA